MATIYARRGKKGAVILPACASVEFSRCRARCRARCWAQGCQGGPISVAVVQRRTSISLPLLANFCIYSGNSSMLKFGCHGTQPGVPNQAAVYK